MSNQIENNLDFYSLFHSWFKKDWLWLDIWLFNDRSGLSLGVWSLQVFFNQRTNHFAYSASWRSLHRFINGLFAFLWQDKTDGRFDIVIISHNEFENVQHWHVPLRNAGEHNYILFKWLAEAVYSHRQNSQGKVWPRQWHFSDLKDV